MKFSYCMAISALSILSFHYATASCPDVKAVCTNPYQQRTVNQKWDLWDGCKLCKTGCGYTSTDAHAYCAHYGGIDHYEEANTSRRIKVKE
jgi:hypothetical protein